MLTLKDVIGQLEVLAPRSLAEKWDHVGLMVGSKNSKVEKILCALDLTDTVLHEAINEGIDCIVTHHPFLFKPLANIDLESEKGRMIAKLIKYNIAVYSMHTNYDIAEGGLNDYLAQLIGLQDVKVLSPTQKEKLCKCIVYVPESHYEVVRETIIAHNNCAIGAYKGCTYTTLGEGTFIPLEGSTPYLGAEGVLEKVQEKQISFMTYMEEVSNILEEIKKVHPYEEIAFDTYNLNHVEKVYGIGRYGNLVEPQSINVFIERLKTIFKISHVRVTDLKEKSVERVAICSGSGAEFIKDAARVADVYITGDLKFHEAQIAQELGITVIDVGHYASENIAMTHIAEYLKEKCEGCQVLVSEVNGETLFTK